MPAPKKLHVKQLDLDIPAVVCSPKTLFFCPPAKPVRMASQAVLSNLQRATGHNPSGLNLDLCDLQLEAMRRKSRVRTGKTQCSQDYQGFLSST